MDTEGLKIGIDFGTCYIKAAGWNRKKKRPRRLYLDKNQQDSDYRLPNTILYQKNEDGSLDIVVGDEDGCRLDPENAVRNIKYYLQQKDWKKYIPNLDRYVTIDDVLKDIFGYIKNTIEEQSGGKEICETVVTTPVCFSEVQKQRIVGAAEKVGLPVKEELSEPLAALFAIIDELNDNKDHKVLIFDFGGATLDLSMVHVNVVDEKINIELMASSGLIYGGINVNEDLYRSVFARKYPDIIPFIENHYQSDNVYKDFLDNVEKIKRMVSKEDTSEKEWRPYTGEKFCVDLELEYDEFSSMLKSLKRDKAIIQIIDGLMEKASIRKDSITDLIMVGGSSRIHYFKELVTQYLGLPVMDLDEDDMYSAVSEGAVRYLHLLNESSMLLNNKLTYSVGVADNENKFVVQIKEGVRYGYKGRRTKPYIAGGKILVYQTFAEVNKVDISNESVIYMGYFDVEEYANDIECLYVLYCINKSGSLYLRVCDGGKECAVLDMIME